jgi:hypothetical protein
MGKNIHQEPTTTATATTTSTVKPNNKKLGEVGWEIISPTLPPKTKQSTNLQREKGKKGKFIGKETGELVLMWLKQLPKLAAAMHKNRNEHQLRRSKNK